MNMVYGYVKLRFFSNACLFSYGALCICMIVLLSFSRPAFSDNFQTIQPTDAHKLAHLSFAQRVHLLKHCLAVAIIRAIQQSAYTNIREKSDKTNPVFFTASFLARKIRVLVSAARRLLPLSQHLFNLCLVRS
jgi:hypothetical protein